MQNQYVLRDIASPHLRGSAQETSDEALIGLIADGDKRAMQVLYARHNVRVYRFILRLTGNQSLAEDLVSQGFLDGWRQAEAFESKSQVSTWLLAIARYNALSALRRRTDGQWADLMPATPPRPPHDPPPHPLTHHHVTDVSEQAPGCAPRSHRRRPVSRAVGGPSRADRRGSGCDSEDPHVLCAEQDGRPSQAVRGARVLIPASSVPSDDPLTLNVHDQARRAGTSGVSPPIIFGYGRTSILRSQRVVKQVSAQYRR